MKLIIDSREKNLIKLCERLLKTSDKFKDKKNVSLFNKSTNARSKT